MKKSSRVGIVLALGLTMASSFAVWEEESKSAMPFGFQSAQASITGTAGTRETVQDRELVLRQSMLRSRQRSALISRVRQQLLDAKPAPASIAR